MNRYLKKILILTVALAMVLTLCSAFGFAESKDDDGPEKLVITGYSITRINSVNNPGTAARVTKGDNVDITVSFISSENIDKLVFTRLVDSFGGGKISPAQTSVGNGSFEITIKSLTYKGSCDTRTLLLSP